MTSALLGWFEAYRRPLPWRLDRSPYRIWVSEVLLQQTRVAQAIPYFRRFLSRFPTLGALAAARPDEVLKVLQGAGYYARARNLLAAARQLTRHGFTDLPTRVAELEQLPGIGRYTARAIASIAFGTPVVALEANGLRVAARWQREEEDVRSPRVRTRLELAIAQRLPADRPGDFNEAVMELGETICLPHHPRCDECPVAFGCRARAELDDPGILPLRPPPRTRPHVRAAIVVLTDRGRWLVQRRPARGLLGGLWEFPGGHIELHETPRTSARRELREETGFSVGKLTSAGIVRHAYSHFSVELHVFRGRPTGRHPALPRNRRWVTTEQLARLPIPKATEKVIVLVGGAGPKFMASPDSVGSGAGG